MLQFTFFLRPFRLRSLGRRATLTPRSSMRAWLSLWTRWTHSCMLVGLPSWLITAPRLLAWDQGSGHRVSTTSWLNKLLLLLIRRHKSTKTSLATSCLIPSMVPLKSVLSWGPPSTSQWLLMQILCAQSSGSLPKVCIDLQSVSVVRLYKGIMSVGVWALIRPCITAVCEQEK